MAEGPMNEAMVAQRPVASDDEFAGHTPGPWTFLPRHIAESEPEVRAPEGWLICCTASDIDARIIAAAPRLLAELNAIGAMERVIRAQRDELLAALRRLVNDSMYKDHPEASKFALAVIAKCEATP